MYTIDRADTLEPNPILSIGKRLPSPAGTAFIGSKNDTLADHPTRLAIGHRNAAKSGDRRYSRALPGKTRIRAEKDLARRGHDDHVIVVDHVDGDEIRTGPDRWRSRF